MTILATEKPGPNETSSEVEKGYENVSFICYRYYSTEIHSLWALFISTLAHSLFKVGLGLHMSYTFDKLTKPQFFPVISWANWEFHFFFFFFIVANLGLVNLWCHLKPSTDCPASAINFRCIYYAVNDGTPMKISNIFCIFENHVGNIMWCHTELGIPRKCVTCCKWYYWCCCCYHCFFMGVVTNGIFVIYFFFLGVVTIFLWEICTL